MIESGAPPATTPTADALLVAAEHLCPKFESRRWVARKPLHSSKLWNNNICFFSQTLGHREELEWTWWRTCCASAGCSHRHLLHDHRLCCTCYHPIGGLSTIFSGIKRPFVFLCEMWGTSDPAPPKTIETNNWKHTAKLVSPLLTISTSLWKALLNLGNEWGPWRLQFNGF